MIQFHLRIFFKWVGSTTKQLAVSTSFHHNQGHGRHSSRCSTRKWAGYQSHCGTLPTICEAKILRKKLALYPSKILLDPKRIIFQPLKISGAMFVAIIFKPSLLKGNDIVQRVPETCLLEGSWSWGSSQSSSLMAPLLAEFHRIHVFFFRSRFLVFFFVFGVFGASEVLAAKKDGGKHAERLVFPNHWNLVSCEKRSRKVFIFSFCWVSQVKHPRWRVTYGS